MSVIFGEDRLEPLPQLQFAALHQGQQLGHRHDVERKLLTGADPRRIGQIVSIASPEPRENSVCPGFSSSARSPVGASGPRVSKASSSVWSCCPPGW